MTRIGSLMDAICFLIEAAAAEKLARLEEEPQPEGAGGAHVEHAHSYTTEPEMHAGWQPSHTYFEDGFHISLRWHPKG